MKKLLCCLVPALLLLGLPTPTPAKTGQLDRGFAGTGKVTAFLQPKAPGRWAPRVHLAWAPGGRIVVAAGTTLFEYLPNGRPNRSFGERGRLRIAPAPSGAVELAGVKVDSRGRILVAGTVSSSPWSASGFVSRYLADGRPDPGFGNGGVVITTLGLPAPPEPPPNEFSIPAPPPSEGPIVKFLGLAVDAADRPVLTGAWTGELTVCYPFLYYSPRNSGLIARLSESGSVDSSFGNGGVLLDPSNEANLSPMSDDGRVLFMGAETNCIRGGSPPADLGRASEDGQLDPSFGSDGRLTIPLMSRLALARDRFGRILILGVPGEEDPPVVQRLTPRGAFDPRFGKEGTVRVPLEGATWPAAISVDRRGRPLVATGRAFRLTRLLRNGRVDHGFGDQGHVRTYFGANASPQQVLAAGNSKIVVGGVITRPDGYRIALARYDAR